MPRLRWGAAVLGVVMLGALLPSIYERFFGRPRLRFTYFTGQLSPAKYDALAKQPGWAASKLEVAPRVSLRGLVRRAREPSAPWVLFYSGNDASLLETGQRFLGRLAGDRDWGLAVFAYRGFESSDGEAERSRTVPVTAGRSGRLGGELELGEASVEAASGAQSVVAAFLDDAAFAHHDDAVRGADGGEAVGNDEGGAVLEQPLEALLD